MEFDELDEIDKSHARPAPRGPDRIRWWSTRILGLLIMGAALSLYLSGPFEALPDLPRHLVPWVLGISGAIVFVLGWLIPWITEG